MAGGANIGFCLVDGKTPKVIMHAILSCILVMGNTYLFPVGLDSFSSIWLEKGKIKIRGACVQGRGRDSQ